jgi:hypothetical protein
MKDLINILSNSNKDIDNQKLMDYLSGKLSSKDANEVEQWLNENEFAEDAIEGLKQMKSKQEIDQYVEQLNKQLGIYIGKRKVRREKRKIDLQWSVVAVIVIVLLAILAYLVLVLK